MVRYSVSYYNALSSNESEQTNLFPVQLTKLLGQMVNQWQWVSELSDSN